MNIRALTVNEQGKEKNNDGQDSLVERDRIARRELARFPHSREDCATRDSFSRSVSHTRNNFVYTRYTQLNVNANARRRNKHRPDLFALDRTYSQADDRGSGEGEGEGEGEDEEGEFDEKSIPGRLYLFNVAICRDMRLGYVSLNRNTNINASVCAR